MLDWTKFSTEIAPKKTGFVTEHIQVDLDHQMGLFYNKTEKILYFGFIQCVSTDKLAILIQAAEAYANQHGCKKIIGPIDGATWANYRFQSSIQIHNSYPGQPTYPAIWANIFLQHNYKISETYETVQINQIEDVCLELSSFKDIDLQDLQFVKPSKEFVIAQMQNFQKVLNEVFTENYQYNEMTVAETQILFSNLLDLINYDFSLLALNNNNEIVGFMLNYVLKNTLYLKTIGLKKSYRNQGLTVFKMLDKILHDNELILKGEIKSIIICLMKKGNFPSLLSKDFAGLKNEYVLVEKIL